LTLDSCLEIAEASVLKRPYDDAPVSNLYLFGRKQDLAFEQAVGGDPRHRHHVRFWRTDDVDTDGRPVWVGSAVYDERVGLSRTTGQVTHVTAPHGDLNTRTPATTTAATSGVIQSARRMICFLGDDRATIPGQRQPGCLPLVPHR
jgi:hypothetical protein